MTGQRCSAQRSKGRGQCGAYAIHGATVCRAHGGRTPQVKRKAAEREVRLAEELGATLVMLVTGSRVICL
jgi:hypothetical protein